MAEIASTGAHYEGGHWLGSFAVYLTTQRGIQPTKRYPDIRGQRSKRKARERSSILCFETSSYGSPE